MTFNDSNNSERKREYNERQNAGYNSDSQKHSQPHEDIGRVPAGQCRHLKSDGSCCHAYALTGSLYCFVHDPASAQKRDAARVKGGKERSRKAAVLPVNTPDLHLYTAGDVTSLLKDTVNQVRRGEIDPRVCNAIGCIAGLLLKAQQQEQMEKRMGRIESVIEDHWWNHDAALKTKVERASFEFVNAEPGSKRDDSR